MQRMKHGTLFLWAVAALLLTALLSGGWAIAQSDEPVTSEPPVEDQIVAVVAHRDAQAAQLSSLPESTEPADVSYKNALEGQVNALDQRVTELCSKLPVDHDFNSPGGACSEMVAG